MATLRAAAYLLNAALLALGLFFLIDDGADDPQELLIFCTLIATPIVNSLVIYRSQR
jgi:hypothetical protein